MVWFWLSLTVLLTVVEMTTVQFVSLWFAVGAAVSTLACAIFPNIGIGWQILIFALTATALLIATRPLVKKFLSRRTEEQKTNLDLILGREALVTEAVNNTLGTGAVKVTPKVAALTIDMQAGAKVENVTVTGTLTTNYAGELACVNSVYYYEGTPDAAVMAGVDTFSAEITVNE